MTIKDLIKYFLLRRLNFCLADYQMNYLLYLELVNLYESTLQTFCQSVKVLNFIMTSVPKMMKCTPKTMQQVLQDF